VTLSQYHEDCCRYLLIEQGLTSATINTYRANFHEFIMWLESERLPLDVSSIEDYKVLRKFMYHLAERRLHKNTVRQRMVSLKTFCKFLLREDILQRNPFDRFDIPKKVKGLPKPLSDNVRDKLLDLIKRRAGSSNNWRDIQAVVILELGFRCGFRKKAMRSMTWENTDLNSGETWVIDKGDKEKIYILLPSTVHWLKILKLSRGVTEGHVLLSPRSKTPISVTSLHDEFKRYVDIAGLGEERINLHRLRHTFGTNALEAGMDIREVQELMGHADIGSTIGYVEVSKKRLRDKIKKRGAFSSAR